MVKPAPQFTDAEFAALPRTDNGSIVRFKQHYHRLTNSQYQRLSPFDKYRWKKFYNELTDFERFTLSEGEIW